MYCSWLTLGIPVAKVFALGMGVPTHFKILWTSLTLERDGWPNGKSSPSQLRSGPNVGHALAQSWATPGNLPPNATTTLEAFQERIRSAILPDWNKMRWVEGTVEGGMNYS